MKTSRNLFGFNILALSRKFNLSRFELHSLYSVYKTLLFDSRNSIVRFKESLEVMLNMNKVMVRPEVLDAVLRDQQGLSF
jgi:acyl-[acyl carrier protein]--UDP-N-acetylglucosamine O-acyltransferase